MRARGALALAVIVALAAADAHARVGGGGTFRTPTPSAPSGGSGGWGGGSRGNDGGEALYLLVRLCLEYPAIGIPTVLLLIAVVWYANRNPHGRALRDRRRAHEPRAAATTDDGWSRLEARDPGISRPALEDFFQLVYRRAWEAASARSWDPLAPYVGPEARASLEAATPPGSRVSEVVVASLALDTILPGRERDRVIVHVESSRRVDGPNGELREYTREVWTFERAASAVSKAPDQVLRLGCPSCGVAVACDPLGRCTSCGAPITAGQLAWQAVGAQLTRREPLGRPELVSQGGTEPSWHARTLRDPGLAAALRAFRGRHPAFDRAAAEARFQHVFVALQEAWGKGRWDDARPYTTDMAWNTLRFWIDRYQRAGLVNRVADARVESMELARVTVDAWYESFTLHIRATLRDWVEDANTHKVVAGDPDAEHRFSEYWTFIRAVGSGDASGDPTRCPSCGAPLDRVNAAGTCGYCDSVITTGRFDWVLSRIEQAEVYRG